MQKRIVGRKSKIKPVLSQKKSEQVKVKLPLLDEVEEALENDGVTLFGNDNVVDNYLVLPRDITEEDSKELGKYLNAFTQQKMWTRTLIGRTSTTVREMFRQLDAVKIAVYQTLPAKMSVKEKDLHFQTDEDAREVLDSMVVYEEKLKLLSDYLHNLEDGIFNISREISRRSSDWDEDKRVDNVGKKRR